MYVSHLDRTVSHRSSPLVLKTQTFKVRPLTVHLAFCLSDVMPYFLPGILTQCMPAMGKLQVLGLQEYLQQDMHLLTRPVDLNGVHPSAHMLKFPRNCSEDEL